MGSVTTRSPGIPVHGDPYRPFFWVDADFRVRGWPEPTARALHRPARAALGRHCWEVVPSASRRASATACERCPVRRAGAGAAWDGTPQATMGAGCCAVLPAPDDGHAAIVWLPLSRIAEGDPGSTHLEGLVLRGALAGLLDSVERTLDGLRRACAADDCELFLLDSSGSEVVLVDCEGVDRDAFLQRTRMPLGAGYPGTVTLSQKPLYTNHFGNDRIFLRQEVKRRGIRSFLGIPLVRDGRPLGYVGLGWRSDAVPMEWGLRILEDVKPLLPLALRDYRLPATAASPVRQEGLVIRCLGAFEVARDGRRIPREAFSRRKALDVLKILVLHQGGPVHREKIAEQLWPGIPLQAGLNRLHVVVNALRSSIEAGRCPRASQYVLFEGDYYRFNTDAPHSVDVRDFEALLGEARRAHLHGHDDRALTLLGNALDLYRGDLFEGEADSEMFEMHRVRLRHLYLDAVREVVRARLCRNQSDEAIRVLRAALAREPVALDLQENLIRELLRTGRLVEARQQYASCRTALRRHLDMELPAHTRALGALLYGNLAGEAQQASRRPPNTSHASSVAAIAGSASSSRPQSSRTVPVAGSNTRQRRRTPPGTR